MCTRIWYSISTWYRDKQTNNVRLLVAFSSPYPLDLNPRPSIASPPQLLRVVRGSPPPFRPTSNGHASIACAFVWMTQEWNPG